MGRELGKIYDNYQKEKKSKSMTPKEKARSIDNKNK